jgi:CheY-like chemotaxis protein
MTEFITAFKKLYHAKHTEEPALAEPVPKRTVLVIDDDPEMLSILRLALYEAGFKVTTSSSGIKGVQALRYAPQSFDAVLLDYSMPGFDGGRALPYVRELAPHTKILCITGHQPKDLPAELRDNVDAVIHKPFDTTMLVQSLHDVLSHTPPLGPPTPDTRSTE